MAKKREIQTPIEEKATSNFFTEEKIEEMVRGLIKYGFPKKRAHDLREALWSLKTPAAKGIERP